MITEDFDGLELSIQAITKAYNEMDKDIYDLCFKSITIIGVSAFLFNKESNTLKFCYQITISLAILFFCLGVVCYWFKFLKCSNIYKACLDRGFLLKTDFKKIYLEILDGNLNNTKINEFQIKCDIIRGSSPSNNRFVRIFRVGHILCFTAAIFLILWLIVLNLYNIFLR